MSYKDRARLQEVVNDWMRSAYADLYAYADDVVTTQAEFEYVATRAVERFRAEVESDLAEFRKLDDARAVGVE